MNMSEIECIFYQKIAAILFITSYDIPLDAFIIYMVRNKQFAFFFFALLFLLCLESRNGIVFGGLGGIRHKSAIESVKMVTDLFNLILIFLMALTFLHI